MNHIRLTHKQFGEKKIIQSESNWIWVQTAQLAF